MCQKATTSEQPPEGKCGTCKLKELGQCPRQARTGQVTPLTVLTTSTSEATAASSPDSQAATQGQPPYSDDTGDGQH